MSLSQQTESVQKIVGTLDSSTAFDAALKHQQDAVMATTRTHRVLNELLDKVTAAGLVPDADSEEDLEVVEQLSAEVKDLEMFAGSESRQSLRIFRGEEDAETETETDTDAETDSETVVDQDDQDVAKLVDAKPAIYIAGVIEEPNVEVVANKSNSAKVAKSILGELQGDSKSAVMFKAPRGRVSIPDISDDANTSNGNRRAA